jgi:two-component system, NarL family, sensor histidine kinase UhpB
MGISLRVLLIEDNVDDAELVLRTLQRGGYDPVSERVDTPLAMDAALDRQRWDVVISDYVMPKFSAPAALAILTSTGMDVPFIIVSGAIGEETAVAAMRAGAHDYISKSNLTRLVPAVNRELREAESRRERKRAEKALAESEERYRKLVEYSPDCILVFMDGRVAFANPAAVSAFAAATSADLMGKTPLDLVHPDFRALGGERMRRAGQGQPVEQIEMKLLRLDGSFFEAESILVPLSFHDRPAVQAVFRDITIRKDAQRKIQEYQLQLRSLASEITLTEERERQRIAQILHDRVAQVLAISKIKLSEVLSAPSSGETTARLGEIMELMRQALTAARILISDLSSPLLYELGLCAAIEKLAEEVQDTHGVKVAFRDDGQPKPLGQDVRTFIYQGVRELLANVTTHSDARNVSISCARDGDRVQIAVTDDGGGFDVDGMWKQAQKAGTLGLFGIRERLGHFGGALEVKSEQGKGTTAVIVAPLNTTERMETGVPAENGNTLF